MKREINLIKTQDDNQPIRFQMQDDQSFTLEEDQVCSWVNQGEAFQMKKLRERIEPLLTSLVQSEHLSLIIGSGLSYAVKELALPLTDDSGTVQKKSEHMSSDTWSVYNDVLTKAANISAKAVMRDRSNFEDDIRVANELCRGLEILSLDTEKDGSITKEDVYTL
ncbi:MAG: hypothetical protein PF450_09325, partial [Bacteroidales bacterium]|nr:hypothetical protein [Bacteroidales bacterium]